LAVPPTHPQRLVYFGTPDMAVGPLRALHDAGHDVVLVVTRADKKRGRGGALVPSPVKAAALELGIPVAHEPSDAAAVGADLGIVVAFGRILRRSLLERLPLLNLHFSLLPRWRGAAPVERAILAGDAQTGVDLMAVEEGLDTGGIYAEAVLDIGPHETADELRVRLVAAGTTLLLDALAAGIGTPRPQVGESVYAEKLAPAELEIDWSRPAAEIDRLVRVGGAWTTFRGKRLKIWRARAHGDADGEGMAGALDDLRVVTGDGTLELVEVQPEGKGRQPASDWARGARPGPGDALGRGDGSRA
jgi:methionyl-tRNA formyltransferase